MFQNASRFRESETPAEKAAWRMLRNRKLVGMKFRRQCPMGKYVADFYCVEAALAIEVDGGVHSQPGQLKKDAGKESFLRKQGVFVLRVPNAMVLDHSEEFLEKVRETIAECLAARAT
jgi:very-short-patch-repair endonuclease